MNNLLILLNNVSRYKNDWGSTYSYGEPNWEGFLMLLVLVLGMVMLIVASMVEWGKLKKDFYKYILKTFKGRIKIIQIPIGLKYILLSMDIKSKNIKSIYRFHSKRLKKMDTYFAYEVNTIEETFHVYFDQVGSDKSWFVYKKGCFDNKPIRIKNNYYDVIEKTNNKLFERIKSNLHKRLKEQSIQKELA